MKSSVPTPVAVGLVVVVVLVLGYFFWQRYFAPPKNLLSGPGHFVTNAKSIREGMRAASGLPPVGSPPAQNNR
ncbi:MAG TPA: hypothetical protein VFB21_00310 [Chthonomonadaceae bacterium]|nr:hypothetical protein [Chthonomonadaceae bacterium]